jgi:hypothetical protein
VLINNDLAVRKKNDTLLKLGWEPQLPKSDRLTFIRICALARILEMGVLEIETLDGELLPAAYAERVASNFNRNSVRQDRNLAATTYIPSIVLNVKLIACRDRLLSGSCRERKLRSK